MKTKNKKTTKLKTDSDWIAIRQPSKKASQRSLICSSVRSTAGKMEYHMSAACYRAAGSYGTRSYLSLFWEYGGYGLFRFL